MKVLAIGESVIDNVYGVRYNSASDIPADTIPTKHVGGSALASIIFLARLGAQCTFLTTIGKDSSAKIILDLLENEKITTIPSYSEKTKVNSILVNTRSGVRTKVRGSITHSDIKELDSEFLQQFDAVIIDRHEREAFYEILRKKKNSTKIFIDPSTEVSDFTLDMIRNADYPILPVEYVENADSRDNIETHLSELYAMCKKTIIVTTGKFGCLIYDGIRIEKIPAIIINPVDVTGAGDIFRGGFAYAMLKGWTLQKSAEFANYVAGLQCKKVGNASAIPTRQEIMAGTNNESQIPFASLHNALGMERKRNLI